MTSPTTSTATQGRGSRPQKEGGAPVNGLVPTGLKDLEDGSEEWLRGREDPPAGGERHVNFTGSGPSHSDRKLSPGTRDGSKKRGRRKEGERERRGEDLNPPSTAKTAPPTTTNITPSHTPHTNTKAIFGPPVNFGVSTSVPPKAPTPGDSTWTKARSTTITTPSSVSSTAHRTSGKTTKIELPEGERGQCVR